MRWDILLNTIDKLDFKIISSIDGAKKIIIPADISTNIEICVLHLPYRFPSNVICVSSQLGCPYKCIFCRNGHRKFYRNLTTQEIIYQVDLAYNMFLKTEFNSFDVTYMGVGEPLNNLDSVLNSIEILFKEYPNLNKVNISTIGLRNIRSLFINSFKGLIHLQFSMHSPFNRERDFLFNSKLPDIDFILSELDSFANQMEDIPCINYLLFSNFNDTTIHANELIKILRGRKYYVKISNYNKIENSDLFPSHNSKKDKFISILKNDGLFVKSFISYGRDIEAGCGQMVSDKII